MSIVCPADVVEGRLITKDKRHELFGQVAGGSGSREPEEFQRAKIQEGTGVACVKTKMRINLRTNTLKDIAHPNKHEDGFDYSEDMDGLQTIGGKTIYINLKCIVGKGGAQTRSLREVYWLVEGQLRFLLSQPEGSICFANILDGDEAAATFPKFQYLLGLPEFATVMKKIYVGDLKGYFAWLTTVCG